MLRAKWRGHVYSRARPLVQAGITSRGCRCVGNGSVLGGIQKSIARIVSIEEAQRRMVMCVPPTFVGEPPRGVRVESHFLSEERKPTPSKLGSAGFPIERFSASSRVIFAWELLRTKNLGFPFEVTSSCFPSPSRSTNPAFW